MSFLMIGNGGRRVNSKKTFNYSIPLINVGYQCGLGKPGIDTNGILAGHMKT